MSKKGRPRKGLTQTIKQRALYLYLPSEEMAEEWKSLAKHARVSVSRFILDHVQNSLDQEKGDYVARSELIKREQELKAENSKLREENRMLRSAYERLDEELKHYRAKPFLEPEFEGIRTYEKELIDLFKKQKAVRSDEILGSLRIDPGNSDLVKAVNRQLELLEKYGIIEPIIGGWKWKV
jgi:ATP-dependent Lon protease